MDVFLQLHQIHARHGGIFHLDRLFLHVFALIIATLIIGEKLFPGIFRFADKNHIDFAPAAFQIQARNRAAKHDEFATFSKFRRNAKDLRPLHQIAGQADNVARCVIINRLDVFVADFDMMLRRGQRGNGGEAERPGGIGDAA